MLGIDGSWGPFSSLGNAGGIIRTAKSNQHGLSHEFNLNSRVNILSTANHLYNQSGIFPYYPLIQSTNELNVQLRYQDSDPIFDPPMSLVSRLARDHIDQENIDSGLAACGLIICVRLPGVPVPE